MQSLFGQCPFEPGDNFGGASLTHTQLAPTLLTYLLLMRIPNEDFYDVTLVSEATDDHDDEPDNYDGHDDHENYNHDLTNGQ